MSADNHNPYKGLSQGDLKERLNEFERLFNPPKSDLQIKIEQTQERLNDLAIRRLKF